MTSRRRQLQQQQHQHKRGGRHRNSKQRRRIMQTYHRKDDIPDLHDTEVPEEHVEHEGSLSDQDERFLDDLIDRRKRKIRRICVSPASSVESVVVHTAISMHDGEVSGCHRRAPTACHCRGAADAAGVHHEPARQAATNPTSMLHNMFGGLAQPMRTTTGAAGAAPASDNDNYSMFGDIRNSSTDNETLTRWSSTLFNWTYGLFGAVLGLGEHIVKTPVLLGITLTTIFMLMIAVQIEIAIAYFVEELLNIAYPAFHGYLLLLENWFTGAAHSTAAFNDLSQATFCDTADRWCSAYGLLCEQRCSFSRIAAERVRGRLR